jgi:hypothetical protein
MKRTMALAAGILVLGAALAAEQIELKPPKPTRAERTKVVREQIAHNETVVRRNNDAEIAKLEKRSAQQGKYASLARQDAERKLPVLRRELDWLEGRLTLASAEQAVKNLETTLAKAREQDRAAIEAAMATARAELEQVKKWEASVSP